MSVTRGLLPFVTDPLVPGIYESVMTDTLDRRLADSALTAEFARITPDDEPHVYARHIAAVVERHVRVIDKGDRHDAANTIINHLIDGGIDTVRVGTYLPPSVRQLVPLRFVRRHRSPR